MKIIVPDLNGDSWHFINDSAVANAGKPFFVPDFADSFEAIPAVLFRISKMGKSIESKFAYRYYTEFAAGLHFVAKELERSLMERGLHTDMAYSYDRSLISGAFVPITDDSANMVLTLMQDGKPTESDQVSIGTAMRAADKAIEAVSRHNILKMGDLIMIPAAHGKRIAIGDRLSLDLDGTDVLEVAVK